MTITVVVPVYGESEWLVEALTSVVEQTSSEWKLLIADDGLYKKPQLWLKQWMTIQNNQNITWNKRDLNLGLFGNLNRAIDESTTEWILLLCSDDKLMPHAVEMINTLKDEWKEVSLILSSFVSINANGDPRPADSHEHHNQIRTGDGLLEPKEMVQALLKLGSINGNLTGMSFTKKHWEEAGAFREDWRHAADWEWLIRASQTKPLLLNRESIAIVRTHHKQLSVQNRRSGDELEEVAEVANILVNHPLLEDEQRRYAWAGHIMQYQLWNLIKECLKGNWGLVPAGLKSIHKSTGIWRTTRSLIIWLPTRAKQKIRGKKTW